MSTLFSTVWISHLKQTFLSFFPSQSNSLLESSEQLMSLSVVVIGSQQQQQLS